MISTNRGTEEIYESLPQSYNNSYDDSKVNQLINKSISIYSKQSEDIITTTLSPTEAFEVFSGKLFFPNSDIYQYTPSLSNKTIESPIQKLLRIKRELADLQSDLTIVTQDGKSSDATIWNILLNETNNLLTASESLENHKAFNILKNKSEFNLNKLKDFIEDIKKSNQPFHDDTKINQSSSSLSSEEYLQQLENRVYTLESILGNSTNTIEVNRAFTTNLVSTSKYTASLGNVPLIESLVKLEEKVSLLDSTALEGIRAKAAALRIELEAASKAKTSIAETRAFEAYKKVEDLHTLVQKIDSIVDELPAIVLRFKSLENIHFSSVDFVSKLKDFDQTITSLTSDVSSNRNILDTLKKNLSENLKSIDQNMASIDSRISKVSK